MTKDFTSSRSISVEDVRNNDIIVDVGNHTLQVIQHAFEGAKTILINGPTGWYEKGFTRQTRQMVEYAKESRAYSFVGGGDLIALMEWGGGLEGISFVSMGGGSLLDYLANGTLPVIQAFEKKLSASS